ncbi:uncharacterized protein DEA37_0004948 [Paragonimus westermani]|uniref:Uncharacterized protein n=1 Tax=Paragonimus westermani TaxID=34504 RepID=A0A5J4P237_9TREM|nr:uncharacterized protein DEA37_0004948 [Paragonimus westermani]
MLKLEHASDYSVKEGQLLSVGSNSSGHPVVPVLSSLFGLAAFCFTIGLPGKHLLVSITSSRVLTLSPSAIVTDYLS